MDTNITLTVPIATVVEILDALHQRLEAWKSTQEYLDTGYADESYSIEDCSNAAEARRIRNRYNAIVKLIEKQAFGSN